MSRKLSAVAASLFAVTLLAGGCAAGPGGGAASTPPASEPPAATETSSEPEDPQMQEPADPPAEEEAPDVAEEAPTPEPTEVAPAVQAESCDWDSPKIAGDSGGAPGGQDGTLETVIVGAWQHTHIDSGSGFEPLGAGKDIRYVFPSTSRILYCQDVKGATDQAENAADITLDGTKIVLPGSAPGYTVASWSADTMVWTNNRDGSSYLLARR